MTWLPLEASATRSERAAVFALQAEASDLWLTVLARTWSIADPDLLDLCRLRMAQLHGCRAELHGVEHERLAALESWRSSQLFALHERAALSYTEQFVIDQNRISEEQRAAMLLIFSPRELCNFVQALNVHDGYLRTLGLLDVAPDIESGATPGSRPSHVKRAALPHVSNLPGPGLDLFEALTDTVFFEARSSFGAATALLDRVDEVTTEVCRLRNARHQACRF